MERDIYNEAFYELNKQRRMRRRKFDLLLRTYSLGGFSIAILAGGYFLFSILPFEFSMRQQMSLIIAGVGLFLAFMSRTLIILRKERETEEIERIREEEIERIREYESIASFLDTWARFERVSKDALSKEADDFNRHSLRSVISRLHEDGKLDETDILALEEALQTRNSIVHGERPFSTKISEKITESLVEIIKKIETS